jgi:apolipoprotein D and lipocalin family protein
MKNLTTTIILLLMTISCNRNKLISKPVQNFDINKYLGTWYEIARTDNKFEKGCTNVSAEYTMRSDGGINVINRCNVGDKSKKASGRGYFRNAKNIGSLKVAFFWPFYGNYNVIYIDKDYQYALVDGGSLDYLWILSKTKTIPQEQKSQMLNIAKENGFNVDNLIYS